MQSVIHGNANTLKWKNVTVITVQIHVQYTYCAKQEVWLRVCGSAVWTAWSLVPTGCPWGSVSSFACFFFISSLVTSLSLFLPAGLVDEPITNTSCWTAWTPHNWFYSHPHPLFLFIIYAISVNELVYSYTCLSHFCQPDPGYKNTNPHKTGVFILGVVQWCWNVQPFTALY